MVLELVMLMISVFFIIIYLAESLILKNIKRNQILIAILNLLVAFFFYMFGNIEMLIIDPTKTNDLKIIDISFIVYHMLIIFVFIVIGYKKIMYGLIQQKHYGLIIKTVKGTKWNIFYIVNKSNKIVDISDSLLEEFELTKKDVMGKNIMDVFDEKITFTEKNDSPINNNELRMYYKNYVNKISEEEIIINSGKFHNSKGSEIFIKFTESPIFESGEYKGRVIIGEKRTSLHILETETKLKDLQKEAQDVKNKYIATLELLSDGLYFRNDETNSIWLNDKMKELIHIYKNNINISEYEGLIHVKDYASHKGIINALTLDRPMYKNRYRININKGYVWIEERGKLVETVDGNEIVVCLNLAQYDQDAIYKGEEDLKKDIEHMIFNEQGFALVSLRLQDINVINRKHGYETGTKFMNQYMEKIIQKFEDTDAAVYKVQGINYGIIIKNSDLFDSLNKALNSESSTLDFRITVDNIEEYIRPKIGAVICPNDSFETNDILKKSYKVLNKVCKDNTRSYMSYSEIFNFDEGDDNYEN